MNSAEPEMQGKRTRRRRRSEAIPPGEPGGGDTERTNEAHRRTALRTAVDDALAGRGRLLLVECRDRHMELLDEVQVYAESRDVHVLRGSCAPGAPDGAPSDELLAGLAAPEGQHAGARAPQARFERFEEIAALLEERARKRPLVILLAGLHHAGRSTLLFVEWLARFLPHCPVAIIGTYEDAVEFPDHPLAETLAELAHEPACQRLALSGTDERTPPAGFDRAAFRLAGDYWTIAFERRVVLVPVRLVSPRAPTPR